MVGLVGLVDYASAIARAVKLYYNEVSNKKIPLLYLIFITSIRADISGEKNFSD